MNNFGLDFAPLVLDIIKTNYDQEPWKPINFWLVSEFTYDFLLCILAIWWRIPTRQTVAGWKFFSPPDT